MGSTDEKTSIADQIAAEAAKELRTLVWPNGQEFIDREHAQAIIKSAIEKATGANQPWVISMDEYGDGFIMAGKTKIEVRSFKCHAAEILKSHNESRAAHASEQESSFNEPDPLDERPNP